MLQGVKFIGALRAKNNLRASSSPTLFRIPLTFYKNTPPGEFHYRSQLYQSSIVANNKMTLPAPGFMRSSSKTRFPLNACVARSLCSQAADYSSSKVFAPYTVFKGKAALSVSPLLPTFRKLGSGGLQLDRRGVIMLTFWPAVGERKYDWDKRQSFALSATEVGSLLSLGSQDSCEFFHDPSMKTSNAGQVRKSLSIKANSDNSGYFISLSVSNNILKTSERLTVPLTAAEFAVIRAASSFALPHILGWDRITSRPPAGASDSKQAAPLIKDLEWDR